MAARDNDGVTDQQLLHRAWELRLRDSLSRVPEASKAGMAAAGVPPTDWAPLTVEEHLEGLQAVRWLEQRLARRDGALLRARQAGASWEQLADALGIDAVVLRARFRVWIAGQRRLHNDIGIGLDAEQAAAAEELLGDVADRVVR